MGKRTVAAVGSGLLLVACATAHPWSSSPALCALRSTASDPGADAWIALLLRGIDPRTRLVSTPAVACTGEPIGWSAPAFACDDPIIARTSLPPRPLTAGDVAVSWLDDSTALVWIQTEQFASGDALGPVALVERTRSRLVVRAIGFLRAFPTRPRLSLHRLGARELLVAEGERCTSGDPASCERAARVAPLVGARFASGPLVDDRGACIAPSLVYLTRSEVEPLNGRVHRFFELSASLVFDVDELRVQELMTVRDGPPGQPPSAGRVHRRAEGSYAVQVEGSRIRATGTPLWARMRTEL
jgi:hypothetical protein